MNKYYQEHKERQDKLRCICYYESKIGKEMVSQIREKYSDLDTAISVIKQTHKLIKEQKKIQYQIRKYEEKIKPIEIKLI